MVSRKTWISQIRRLFSLQIHSTRAGCHVPPSGIFSECTDFPAEVCQCKRAYAVHTLRYILQGLRISLTGNLSHPLDFMAPLRDQWKPRYWSTCYSSVCDLLFSLCLKLGFAGLKKPYSPVLLNSHSVPTKREASSPPSSITLES